MQFEKSSVRGKFELGNGLLHFKKFYLLVMLLVSHMNKSSAYLYLREKIITKLPNSKSIFSHFSKHIFTRTQFLKKKNQKKNPRKINFILINLVLPFQDSYSVDKSYGFIFQL